MKKIMRNRRILKIVIILLLVFILSPFVPYKCILDFGGLSYNGYKKLKIENSSQDGPVLVEDCDELGLKNGMEVDRYLLNYDKLGNELTIFKYGLSGYKFTLYGEFVKDDNGTKKFFVREWNSVYVTLSDTYIWEEKIMFIYMGSLLPTVGMLVFLLIKLKKQKVKDNNLLW